MCVFPFYDGMYLQHLHRYSMEILLAYLEFAQFQEFVQTHLSDSDMDIVDENIRITSTVPVSMIVDCTVAPPDDIDMDAVLYNTKIKAHKLFNKYVRSGSEYEINIKYDERNKLETILSDLDRLLQLNINLKDFYLLFKDCKNEMFTLLTFSLARFKQTKEFEEIDPSSLQIFVKTTESALSLDNVEMA